MRFSPALVLLSFFLASPIRADVLDGWCAQATLPSSITICSDPGLRALTIERQHAFDAARARVGQTRFPALMADQNAWVASYPKTCGVAADAAPPIPLPTQIRSCMAAAGQARIDYLHGYGIVGPSPLDANAKPQPTGIGPSFDCSKVKTPLAILICGSPQLARIDAHFNQAYWALRNQLPPDGRQALAEEDSDFLNSVLVACDVPEEGAAHGSTECVGAHYDAQRARWAARLTGPALEEANRAPEQHTSLQASLQKLGFLPSDARIDGVYGPATRSAISAWQTARGRSITGFVSDDDARTLSAEIFSPAAANAAPPIPFDRGCTTPDLR
jgi:uncharacterized protein